MASCIIGGSYLYVIGREFAIMIGLVLIFTQQFSLFMIAELKD